MSTRLEKILEDIDPSTTYDQTFARADNAINSFSGTCAQITDFNEFSKYMAGFTIHVEAKILQLHPCPTGHDFYWLQCVQILCQIYGTNGEKAAFEMARTGKEGGLFAVLKAVALRMAEEHAENEISARVMDYWNKHRPQFLQIGGNATIGKGLVEMYSPEMGGTNDNDE